LKRDEIRLAKKESFPAAGKLLAQVSKKLLITWDGFAIETQKTVEGGGEVQVLRGGVLGKVC